MACEHKSPKNIGFLCVECRVVDERGHVEQRCSTCGLECSGSTIWKKHADTYDKRCPKCKTETMVAVRWQAVKPGAQAEAKRELSAGCSVCGAAQRTHACDEEACEPTTGAEGG